jgi:hypothetical protein
VLFYNSYVYLYILHIFICYLKTFLFLLYLGFFTFVNNITVIQLQILQILKVYFVKFYNLKWLSLLCFCFTEKKNCLFLLENLVIKIEKYGIILLY